MLTAHAMPSLVFLILTLPICLWVSFSDLKFMKIPNKSVIALTFVFVIFGLIMMPWKAYGWGLAQLVIVLALGFVLTIAGAMGAGDAKFGAAMAAFIAPGDWQVFLAIFSACLLAGFVLHRIARAIPAIRRASTDWISWGSKKYPMGLSLATSLMAYLAAGVAFGQ